MMKQEEKDLLVKLTREKRFPLNENNTTIKERKLITCLMSENNSKDIKNIIRKECLLMKKEGVL